ncbi:ligase-associated DNA damage response exonuclease [Pseudomonas typographi]|uniref:Ligase-associated DNA damage response exonuclease n=1 Tax=Pseudomonas typographi TaxID=2715964 RepID=A0ABR7Z5E9_9PSED|nr:ligase-associated DNA damage response exonuclease [Pseudomonas typographi]
MDLVIARREGLYCPPGNFYIDPWRPVPHAVITHGHGDHARTGNGHYLAAAPGEGILRTRLGQDIDLQVLPYGQRLVHNGVTVSFHPAGHVLGSAQVRLEYQGEVWVASGDYKVEADGTCAAFEPVRCHTFITESTFGLPIYRWQAQQQVFEEINQWWRANIEAGRPSVLFAYAFGKAQRILHGIDASLGPILAHGAVEPLNRVYRAAGVELPPTLYATEFKKTDPTLRQALIIAPPSAAGSTWMRRFGQYSDGFASGWMRLRGTRRRRGVDRGFVLSDHADWPGLLWAIEQTGAERVMVTHGSVAVLARYLREQRGLDARGFDEAGMSEFERDDD